MIGTTVGGQYRIVEEIGRGGMGVVYRGEDLKLHRPCALKFLDYAGLGNSEAVARVLKEARTLAAVEHARICPIHNVIETEDAACLVMGFIEGVTLKDRLANEGPLAWSEAVRLVREAAEGLHAAHRQGIIHRDIKPENLMQDVDGHVKVMDFGVARRQDATLATIEGGIAGTAAYMAPEQWKGEEPDARTDVWGLGAVLYELLAGRVMFTADFPQAVMYAVLNSEPDPLSGFRKDLPADLQGVLGRMLRKNPADRYGDMPELIADLEALLAGERTAADSVPGRPGKRRVRVPGYLGAAAAVLAVGLAIWQGTLRWGGGGGPPPDDRKVVVLPFTNRTGDSGLDNLGMLAAESYTEQLGELENIEVFPVPQVAAGGEADGLPQAARASGAGTVISGSYYLNGEDLAVQVKVTGPKMRRHLFSVPRAVGPVSDPLAVFTAALDRLRGGVLLAVASSVREPISQAPRFEAAQEYLTGLNLTGVNKHVPHLVRAAQIDTTFLYAPLYLLGGLDEAMTDSLMGVFQRRRSSYSPYERCRIDAAVHGVSGNFDDALAALQEALAVQPGDLMATYMLTSMCFRVNRPRLGIRTYREMRVPDDWATSRSLEFQGIRVAWMYYWLGDYETMLAFAEEMIATWPGTNRLLALKMTALAGLGRYAAVDSVTLDLLSQPGGTGDVPYVMEIAMRQLAIHERWDEARLMADRGHAWLDAQSEEDIKPSVVSYYRMHLELHTNRWARLDSLVALDPDPLEEWGPIMLRYPGRAAAHLGDRERALMICEMIKPKEPVYMGNGRERDFANWCLHEQAAIRAILGDREEAVALLREAFRRGWFKHGYVFPDPAFADLEDYEPYLALMRPRG